MAINEDIIYEVDDRGERVLVKSIEAATRAYLRFTNRTSRPVDVWWRDFHGKKRHYIRLDPGAYYDINTYLTHPWEFTDAATKDRFVINNKSIFRAPPQIGGMWYRTNWNISVPVCTLRQISMMTLATMLPHPEAANDLGLPRVLTTELQELVSKLENTPTVGENE